MPPRSQQAVKDALGQFLTWALLVAASLERPVGWLYLGSLAWHAAPGQGWI